MEYFIGVGFVVLSIAVLVGICGIFGYAIHIHKKNADISLKTNVDKSK